MRLSIGITSYNQGRYVEDTIQSLLNQSVLPDEIVVSDNHSTDGSYDILQKYSDRIKVIQPLSHLPYYEHINFLLKNLKGDWVMLAASDDTYLPNMVYECYKHLDEESVAISFGFNLIDAEDRYKGTKKYCRWLRNSLQFPDNCINSLCYNSIPMWSTIYKRKSLMAIGGFGDLLVHFDHDWATTIKLSRQGCFRRIPNVVICNYRAEYRPDVERIRLEGETKDTAILCNTIIKNIFNEKQIDMSLLDKARLFHLKKKINLYKKYGREYSEVFREFYIDNERESSFTKWDLIFLLYKTKKCRLW